MPLYNRGNSRRSGRSHIVHDKTYWDELRAQFKSCTHGHRTAYSPMHIKRSKGDIGDFRSAIQESEDEHRKWRSEQEVEDDGAS